MRPACRPEQAFPSAWDPCPQLRGKGGKGDTELVSSKGARLPHRARLRYPFYRERNRGPERLRNALRVTQPGSGGAGFLSSFCVTPNPWSRVCSPGGHTLGRRGRGVPSGSEGSGGARRGAALQAHSGALRLEPAGAGQVPGAVPHGAKAAAPLPPGSLGGARSAQSDRWRIEHFSSFGDFRGFSVNRSLGPRSHRPRAEAPLPAIWR